MKLNFVQLTAEDIERLYKVKPIIENNIAEIVGEFYARLQQMPRLLNIINHNSSIDKLSRTLTNYLLDMVSGKVDEAYVEGEKL